MQKIIHLLAPALLLSSAMHAATSCVKPVSISCPTIDCNINVVHISQSDVTSAGYVISKPGRYCLVENITFAPTTNGTSAAPLAAFTITSSNVQFDLNGYNIFGPATFTNTVGIKVATPSTTLTNVIIQNGSIQGFTLGIYIDPVNSLVLQYLAAVGNGTAGSITTASTSLVGGIAIAAGSQNILVQGVNASNNGGTSANVPTYGLFITDATNTLIANGLFNSNVSTSNAVHGLSCHNFTALKVISSIANNNSGLIQSAGIAFIGDIGSIGTDLSCSFCIANDNFIQGSQSTSIPNLTVLLAAGFYVVNTINLEIDHCQATDTFADVSPALLQQRASGFELTGVATFVIDSCQAVDNLTFNTLPGYGFHISGIRGTVNNSSATTTGASGVTGFRVERYVNDSRYGALPVSQINILNSVAQGNTYGIYYTNVVDSVIENNIVENNAIDGLLLDQTAPCGTISNMIKYNQFIDNKVWGIEDNSGNPGYTGGFTGPANAYIGNKAFDNGPGAAPGISNYNTGVVLAGADSVGYIGLWAIPGPIPAVINPVTNLDMTKDNGC